MIEKSINRDNRAAWVTPPDLKILYHVPRIYTTRRVDAQIFKYWIDTGITISCTTRTCRIEINTVKVNLYSGSTLLILSPHESPTFNMNILNTSFEQPRGREIKWDKPWKTSTSVFHATSADGTPWNATLPQLCETPQSTYSAEFSSTSDTADSLKSNTEHSPFGLSWLSPPNVFRAWNQLFLSAFWVISSTLAWLIFSLQWLGFLLITWVKSSAIASVTWCNNTTGPSNGR